MHKWFTEQSKFMKFKGRVWIVPCISIWYDKYSFLETGVYTSSFGFQVAWLSWSYGFKIQKGY